MKHHDATWHHVKQHIIIESLLVRQTCRSVVSCVNILKLFGTSGVCTSKRSGHFGSRVSLVFFVRAVPEGLLCRTKHFSCRRFTHNGRDQPDQRRHQNDFWFHCVDRLQNLMRAIRSFLNPVGWTVTGLTITSPEPEPEPEPDLT